MVKEKEKGVLEAGEQEATGTFPDEDLGLERGKGGNQTAEYRTKVDLTLKRTKERVLEVVEARRSTQRAASWEIARALVADFEPVPWFIWRLNHYVLGQSGKINKISEGMVYGLRRLVLAAANDELLGDGTKIREVRKAISVVNADVLAAASVIHAICRRLASREHERIWRPILDDAILRARLGYLVGCLQTDFGAGRGMLAGFASRCGLAIMIASGDLDKARSALDMLAAGHEIGVVGLDVYSCEPVQVSALALVAAGCGPDSAFGIASFVTPEPLTVIQDQLEPLRWLAAFSISEYIRLNQLAKIDEKLWQALRYDMAEDREELQRQTKSLIREGHGWDWLG